MWLPRQSAVVPTLVLACQTIRLLFVEIITNSSLMLMPLLFGDFGLIGGHRWAYGHRWITQTPSPASHSTRTSSLVERSGLDISLVERRLVGNMQEKACLAYECISTWIPNTFHTFRAHCHNVVLMKCVNVARLKTLGLILTVLCFNITR